MTLYTILASKWSFLAPSKVSLCEGRKFGPSKPGLKSLVLPSWGQGAIARKILFRGVRMAKCSSLDV